MLSRGGNSERGALGGVVPSNEVINDIRVTKALSNRLLVANIPFLSQPWLSRKAQSSNTFKTYHSDNLTEVTHELQMPRLIFVTVGSDNLGSNFACTEKSSHRVTRIEVNLLHVPSFDTR
jgi:hypothetical protein